MSGLAGQHGAGYAGAGHDTAGASHQTATGARTGFGGGFVFIIVVFILLAIIGATIAGRGGTGYGMY